MTDAPTKTVLEITPTLMGQCFHSIHPESGQIEWQGIIIGNPEPGWYLVQLFEWVTGAPNVRRLVRIDDLRGWLLYGNAEMMKESFDHGAARAGGPYGRY